MVRFPPPDRGMPPAGSPAGFMRWLARGQLPTLAAGAMFGVLWMLAQAVIPAALGEAVESIVRHDRRALVAWSAVLLGLGVFQAVFGVLRHRRAVTNFLLAASAVQMLVTRAAAALGADLSRQVEAGEVANLGTTDVERIGLAVDISARFSGAVVSYLAVAALLLVTEPELGAVVVLGVPLAVVLIGPLMRPLVRRQSAERDRRAEASSLAADTVVGLRILRGLGGEGVFSERFRTASQRVRAASVRTALAQANLDALQVFLPGLLLVAVTFLGARLAVEGRITAGQLVAFYAYTAFLVLPVRTFTEMAAKWTAALVAAGRVLSVLRLEPALAEPDHPAAEPAGDLLVDETTGLSVEPGIFTGVACATADEAAHLAGRLGRYEDPADGRAVRLGGVRLADLPRATVRRRVMVIDRQPGLLSGPVSATLDPPRGRPGHRGPGLDQALEAASARDVLDGLPDGLATELPERGRSISGGQRQRFVLAQALVADPGILVLDDPTSAVDAHTEAAIAGRLKQVRAGSTTVVLTTSPLVLAQADRVAYVDGVVTGAGSHDELLRSVPAYRELVSRGWS